jgi:hypothetical protein
MAHSSRILANVMLNIMEPVHATWIHLLGEQDWYKDVCQVAGGYQDP